MRAAQAARRKSSPQPSSRPGPFGRDMGVRLRDVEDAGRGRPDGEQGGGRRGIDMERRRGHRLVRPGSRSVDVAVAKHHALQRRRIQRPVLERGHALHADRAAARRVEIERVRLRMRLRPGRIHPGDALRDEPARARRDRRLHQVARTFVADPGVARERFRHPGGIVDLLQIGELVDHHVRPERTQRVRERFRIEHVDLDGLGAQCAQPIRARGRPGRSRHGVTGFENKRGQAAADRAGRARDENPVWHRLHPFLLSIRCRADPAILLAG